MRTTKLSRYVLRGALLATFLVALGTMAARAEDDDGGAAGTVRGATDSAAESTKRGLTKAGEAVGGAIDTAISKTGQGVGRALDATGNGIQRAGRALSGDSSAKARATQDEAPAPEAVPEHPIQEEPLDE
jgi:hypothetical protein